MTDTKWRFVEIFTEIKLAKVYFVAIRSATMVRALWCVACVIAVGLVNARAPAIESKADSVIITVDDGQDVTVQYLDVDDNMVATVRAMMVVVTDPTRLPSGTSTCKS